MKNINVREKVLFIFLLLHHHLLQSTPALPFSHHPLATPLFAASTGTSFSTLYLFLAARLPLLLYNSALSRTTPAFYSMWMFIFSHFNLNLKLSKDFKCLNNLYSYNLITESWIIKVFIFFLYTHTFWLNLF